MDTMKLCPICHKSLAPNAPDGLCPACLLKAGVGTGLDLGRDSQPGSGPTALSAPAPEEVARWFPQLEILGFLGQGGMGAVYKARQKALDRIVALKILPPGVGHAAAFAERFRREAKALARLNHPGIVTLYEFGETSGQFYFLMEYVDGVTLRELLQAGRVSAREALAIVPQICDALQFAHDMGIVHRDIKPENILLDRRGRVKVADFGLAKIVAAHLDGSDAGDEEKRPSHTAAVENLTDAGKVMGTPQYMSPEQMLAPAEVDHRADIYALGVVFYQMLTGELPGQIIEPPSRKVQVDVRLDEVVLRALEKKPELRYQQASLLKTEVETIVTELGKGSASPAVSSATPGTAVKTTLSNVAFGAAWASGIFAVVSWYLMPHGPRFLPWAILATALGALGTAIPVRHTPRGKWALWFSLFQCGVWLLFASTPRAGVLEKLGGTQARPSRAGQEPAGGPVSEAEMILAAQPPVVVETVPASGQREVPPGETEIRVRFSKPMMDESWSWVDAWENSAPAIIGSPRYEADGRTCTAKVKLEPGRTYAFWLNTERFNNFADRAGQAAIPYLLIFQTRGDAPAPRLPGGP